MIFDLPVVFTVLMGAAILAYVVLDGYDLGVGMLMPWADEREQDVMVSSIGPFWDANETWLVLGIGLLLVAFPVAHGIILTALYLSVVVMLVGLLLRGVAFEFRIKAEGWHRGLWNRLFWFGSLLAAFAQGLMLGSYLTGFGAGPGNLLFILLVAVGLCGGYVLLGATWLILRTEGALQTKATGWTRWGLVGAAAGLLLVSGATPLVSETVRDKWLALPQIFLLGLLPLATVITWVWVWRSNDRIARGQAAPEWAPFAGAMAIFLLAFAGMAYSLFPYIVIDRVTIWDAAAHPTALVFVLVGVCIVLPFILAYTVYSYRVFRGKASGNLYEE